MKADLANRIEKTADWRSRRADEFPSEAEPSLKAARSLRRLAANLRHMADEEFERLYAIPFMQVDERYVIARCLREGVILGSSHFSIEDPRDFFAHLVSD